VLIILFLIGATLQVVASALQAPALPFPAFVITFLISGIGTALQVSLFVRIAGPFSLIYLG
jgi:hypothetical protein